MTFAHLSLVAANDAAASRLLGGEGSPATSPIQTKANRGGNFEQARGATTSAPLRPAPAPFARKPGSHTPAPSAA